MKTLQKQHLTFWFSLNNLQGVHEGDAPDELVSAFYRSADKVGQLTEKLPLSRRPVDDTYTVPVYEMCEPGGDYRTHNGLLVWPLEIVSESVLSIECVKEFWELVKRTFESTVPAVVTSVTLISIEVTSTFEVTEKSELAISTLLH